MKNTTDVSWLIDTQRTCLIHFVNDRLHLTIFWYKILDLRI